MKKFLLVVAITLAITLLLPVTIANAVSQCPACKSYNIIFDSWITEVKGSAVICYTRITKERLMCMECLHWEGKEHSPTLRTHSWGLLQDSGCHGGVHTWTETCIYNDCKYVRTTTLNCPGPPDCWATPQGLLAVPM